MPNPITSGVQPVKIQGRSGFDKSFKNLLTAKPGTLVPLLCDPVIAGSRVHLAHALRGAMPPLASDTFMNAKIKLESFYVPASSLYGGFNDFVTKRDVRKQNVSGIPAPPGAWKKAILPYLALEDSYVNRATWFGPGTLADYLGFRDSPLYPSAQDQQYMPNLNILPFLAYHRVYDRFYRNSLIQKPLFSKISDIAPGAGTFQTYDVGNLPYLTFCEGEESHAGVGRYNGSAYTISPSFLNDAWAAIVQQYPNRYDPNMGSLFGLWQRNFGADYFTTATPTAQKGNPAAVEFTVDLNTGDGSISIAAVRAMNAMQLFRERNNYVDDNIHAYNRAHYGVDRTGYGESLPVFLGQSTVDMSTRGVDQSSEYSSGNTQNPFASVGAQYGQAEAAGQGKLIEGFEAPEFGYIMVIGSLVPQVAYSSGLDRHLLDLVNGEGVADIPDPILQNTGPQPVYNFELDTTILGAVSPSSPDAWKAVFGYQQKYAHYMERLDQVHGLFKDGQSLQSFALQRSLFYPQINSMFLMVPQDYFDQIAAVQGDIAQYGYWMDVYFDYKVSMPLAAYSIPSLENPDGSTEWVNKPGYQLR